MTATASVPKSNNQDIDGLLSAIKWNVSSLTFSFPTDPFSYASGYGSGEPNNNFAPLTATQLNFVRSALQQYSSVINLTLSETSGGAGELRFAKSDAPSTAWAYYPSTAGEGGDSWYRNSGGTYDNPVKGNYAAHTFLHEIGHALGLKHGHETDVYGALPAAHDSLEYSVMTYRSYIGGPLTGYTYEAWGAPQTLMQDDIAALQYLYGANFNTNSGDTTYSWNPTTGEEFINGVGQGAPGGNRIFMTLWDGNGTDTYDFSNYTTNLSIDLQPGHWTTVSTAQLANLGAGHFAAGNIANALQYGSDPRSLIESAIGGSGNDTIIGNQANNVLRGMGGNDIFVTGAGNNFVDGGAGTDTLDYTSSPGAVTINLSSGSGLNGYGGTENFGLVENVTGSALGDYIVGDALSNVLRGLGGDDTLNGGGGDNHLNGGVGTDTLDFTAAPNGVTMNLDAGSGLNGYGGVDTFGFFENLTGSAFNDALYGNAGDNTLRSHGGDDWLVTGAGNNFADGGVGSDTLDYSASPSGVTINLNAGSGLNGYGGADNFGFVENIVGSSLSDFFMGGSGDNILRGGNGDDTLIGLGGNNILDGGLGIDTLDYSAAPSAVTINLGSGSGLNGSGGADTFGYVENVIGSVFADLIAVGSGVNVLTGGAENDIFQCALGLSDGDIVTDFNGNGAGAGDILRFTGYGTVGATFVQIDAMQWQINSADGLVHEIITFSNAASIYSTDYIFV